MLDSYAIAVQGLGFGRLLLAMEGLLAVPEVMLDSPVFHRDVDAPATRRVGGSAATAGTRRIGAGSPTLSARRIGSGSVT